MTYLFSFADKLYERYVAPCLLRLCFGIDFDEKQKRLEITHRIFLDDLEVALTDWTGEQVDVLNPSDPDQLQ